MTPLQPIADIAAALQIHSEQLTTLGRYKAKVEPLKQPPQRKGKLVLVTAVTPTPAGEGKTTMSIGLTQGLHRLGTKVMVALREPSLGPVFGVKGGGTGGGMAQVEPADDINLHFTGDIHAIGSAHNLLAAMVDNALHFNSELNLDPARVSWPRVMDMNDRALRRVTVDAGGKHERATRFDITAASEIMAIMALARNADDLQARLDAIVVGTTHSGEPVRARDLQATDAMRVLLRDALKPNLVQTREGAPALVHLGPFANIAHGCSSVVGTDWALAHADVVLTEAGFGFDLGGEKFLHLKMRSSGHWPHAVVLVATVRALKSHGGGSLGDGLAHLQRQIDNVHAFGLPLMVALNVFPDDTEAELAQVEAYAQRAGVASGRSTAFRDGGAGATDAAETLLTLINQPARPPQFLYPKGAHVLEALEAVSTRVYGAAGVALSENARRNLSDLEANGYAHLPVCVAKTHLSFSDDPKAGGLASGFTPTVAEFRLAAGAGFVVARMGSIFTMPGLPREPAAARVRILADGRVQGLMQGS